MHSMISEFLEHYGALGVAALMLLENIFPPIPSELVMPWAGYSVSQSEMSFAAVVTAGSCGSFIGAMLWYFLARWIGKDRLARWIEGHGVWLTITPQDLDRVEDWFDAWGTVAVFVCRMIPGLRTLISVPAGFAQMPIGRFTVMTALGTVIWTALLAGLGWWLGDNYSQLAGPLGWISTAVVAAMFAWWVYRLVQHRSRSANEA
ncbi:DedA family protein [Allorhodopirellula solitaria]|uniref:Inner membrane protein YghB n=1 Tax=Allorhodopirellula solitaria TaxID=2527987 RepID=A0A5C5XRB0_9BACT|nr:DedA family protein [Allorhodopirellula solitaria]TWT64893.1 Inner membrane protein YghB [Allorhodopirellula solitaria]